MSVRLYMDEHVARSITLGLRQRGVDVITAQEDGRSGASDVALLDRATELRRALFTQATICSRKVTGGSRRASPSAGWCTPISLESPSEGWSLT